MNNIDMLDNCNLCIRNCNINRNKNIIGVCKTNNIIKIARADLHFWEEPCISGVKGSGTVFFSNCNLKCVFCQNHKISQNGFGKQVTIERLAEIFIELQNKGANNINLVTPTHYVPLIIESIKIAKSKGLILPIVYNTNSTDYNNFGDHVFISLMNQYTPLYNAKDYPEINKSVNPKLYDSLINYALSIGVKNGFIQGGGTDTEEFVPDFNNKGV